MVVVAQVEQIAVRIIVLGAAGILVTRRKGNIRGVAEELGGKTQRIPLGHKIAALEKHVVRAEAAVVDGVSGRFHIARVTAGVAGDVIETLANDAVQGDVLAQLQVVAVKRPARPGAHSLAGAQHLAAALGQHIDRAAQGAAAVQRRGRAADDFEPFQGLDINEVEVAPVGGIVIEPGAVNGQQDARAAQPANRGPFGDAAGSRNNVDARLIAEQVGEVLGLVAFDVLTVDDADMARDIGHRAFFTFCGCHCYCVQQHRRRGWGGRQRCRRLLPGILGRGGATQTQDKHGRHAPNTVGSHAYAFFFGLVKPPESAGVRRNERSACVVPGRAGMASGREAGRPAVVFLLSAHKKSPPEDMLPGGL